MNLISDEQLEKIPIKENHEKLVYVKDVCPKVAIRLGRYITKEGEQVAKNATKVRQKVAEKLNEAHSFLPKGYRIALRCGYRPLSLQKKKYDEMFKKLKKKNPTWSLSKIKDETGKRVAPVDIVPPHSTGGAVDVSLIDPNARVVKMGTQAGKFNEKTQTCSEALTKKEKENRKILINAMDKAGFVNYPTEWWHWSYGDRYWAAYLKKKHSIYGGL